MFVMREKVMIFLVGLVDNWCILWDSGFCGIYHETLTIILRCCTSSLSVLISNVGCIIMVYAFA